MKKAQQNLASSRPKERVAPINNTVINYKEDILPDVLKENLKVVFCGLAAGKRFGKVMAYYAGSGNQFYKTLQKIKLTPIEIESANYKKLLFFKIGLTDLAKNVKTEGTEENEYDVKGFNEKIEKYKPKLVCFNGKEVAAAYFFGDVSKASQLEYGLSSEKIANVKLVILPNSSSSAREQWDLTYWKEMVKHI